MMAKRKKKVRKVKSTLIIVGEGGVDYAFLKYMQGLYDRNVNRKITIRAGDGGSPADVIHAASKRRDIGYDERWILIDSDIELTLEDKKLAGKRKVHIIQSEPVCIEGMLLKVLGKEVPSTNSKCKKVLHPLLSSHPTKPQSYAKLFPKSVLDETAVKTITELLVKIFKD